MSKLTKDEVATWIRNLVPYLENPMVLAPKGCFDCNVEPAPGLVLKYDAALVPHLPKVLDQTESVKALVELYRIVEQ